MGALSPTHWLIVLGVLALLFGAKKLPDLARSVGQSARVLKGEMEGLRHDGVSPSEPAAPTALPEAARGAVPTEVPRGVNVPPQ